MAKKAVFRVMARGLVFGCPIQERFEDISLQESSILVPPLTEGNLLNIGSDGFMVRWDTAFAIPDEIADDDYRPGADAMRELGPTVVETELGQMDRIPSGPISFQNIHWIDCPDEEVCGSNCGCPIPENPLDLETCVLAMASHANSLMERITSLAQGLPHS